MSYGQASRELRDAFTVLLVDRPRAPYPSRRNRDNPEARERERVLHTEYAALIQTYRLPALQWVRATLDEALPTRVRTDNIMWAAPAALRRKVLTATDHAQTSTPRPSREQLATPHDHPVVEAWRQVSIAAVRCLTQEAGALEGMSRSDSLLAIRDTTDLIRAIVIIDDRYHQFPGWEHLSGGHTRSGDGYSFSWGLLRAAERCAMWVNAYSLSPDLDGRGTREGDFDHHGTYHLRERITPGPYPPGPAGAIDALHNGLVRLQRPLKPVLARHLLLRNFHLAKQLAHLAEPIADETTRSLKARAARYRALLDATTDLSGTGASDPGAVQEFDSALVLLKATTTATHDQINVLHRLLTHSDRRIAALMRDAIDNQTYLVARGTTVSRGASGAGTQVAPRLIPITYESARVLQRAAKALAEHARAARAEIYRPQPRTDLIAEDALAHRDAFAASIYAGRRGTTQTDEREGLPKSPQIRAMGHIRHAELQGPASPEDLRAYLEYAVHNRPRHRWLVPLDTHSKSRGKPFQPRRAPNENDRRPGRARQSGSPDL